MQKTTLGKTGLQVTRTAFGVLPLQRTEKTAAAHILRRAYDAGINFFDTARAYSDSEEKIGYALADVRDRIIIASKSGATSKAGVMADLEESLRNLRTDYLDILQLHNPAELPDPNDPNSSYAALLAAREQGKIRHFGITNHRLAVAQQAVASGLYETLQFPLCHISATRELALIESCRAADMGVIAMKALSGGLLTRACTAFAFLRQYENVVPIWGIQHMHELDELLALDADPPLLDADTWREIEHDREELAGNFCRACGYCLPCPAKIPIPMAGRMSLLLRRMPYEQFLTHEWQEMMARIENCTNCGHCRANCPYGLDTPNLLQEMLADYQQFLQQR